MQEPVYSEILRGHKIEIHYDTEPCNPRTEWYNSATMVCVHGRYNLGDEQYDDAEAAIASVYDRYHQDEDTREYTMNMLDKCPIISLPLYLYDHSGITMNTTGFSCPWDSGQVGFIWIDRKKAEHQWPLDMFENVEQWEHAVCKYLKGEVSTYNDYLTNNVYGYRVLEPCGYSEEDDEQLWTEIDSCWGFYGDYDGEYGCLVEARSAVPEPEETFIMVFHSDGSVEFTRSPKLYDFFEGRGSMERISEIKKLDNDDGYYYIEWLKGPQQGIHTYEIARTYAEGEIDFNMVLDGILYFFTYEEAVSHEIDVLMGMRRQGVTFIE